jgi:integrase/recombinase XerD
MREPEFTSALAPMLYAYVEWRRREGYTNTSPYYYLQEFDCLVASKFNTPFVTQAAITAWDAQKPYLTNRSKIPRHNTIRAFAAFAFARDGQSYIPDTSKIRNVTTFTPYIFSKEEIAKLLDAADRIPLRKNAPLREIILPAVFRLLYCCGFRVSEILRLKKTDIDLDTGVISVKDGKGGKDRLVPLHGDLKLYMQNYYDKLPKDAEWLFPSATGHYALGTIYQNFRELLIECNIPHTGHGPRVHDLRHTFSVHTLEQQLDAGYDPMVIMPRLAAYLGHKSYRETCWYLHLTIATFPKLSEKLDTAFAGIIPAVGGSPNEKD